MQEAETSCRQHYEGGLAIRSDLRGSCSQKWLNFTGGRREAPETFAGVKFGSASCVQEKVSVKTCEDEVTQVTVSEIPNLATDAAKLEMGVEGLTEVGCLGEDFVNEKDIPGQQKQGLTNRKKKKKKVMQLLIHKAWSRANFLF